MAGEQPDKVEIPIDFTYKNAMRSLAELQTGGEKALQTIMKGNKQASISVAEHGARQINLESIYKRSLRTSEKTALLLAEVKAARVEDAEAIDLQKKAIAGLDRQMEDQLKRENANKGRSLSMLFDELKESLLNVPGPLGKVTQAMQGAAEKGSEKLGRSSQKGAASMAAMLVPAALMTTAAVGLAASLAAAGMKTADTANQISLLAASSGVSAEGLSRFRLAAERLSSGARTVELKDFAEAIAEVSSRLQDAQDPTSSQARAFKAVGLEVKDLKGLKPDDLFVTVATAIAKLPDPTEQTHAAMALLGDELALKVLPALRESPGALEAMRLENDAVGLSMRGPVFEAAKKYRQSIIELKTSWLTLSETVGQTALPVLAKVTTWFTNYVVSAKAGFILMTQGKEAWEKYGAAVAAQNAALANQIETQEAQTQATGDYGIVLAETESKESDAADKRRKRAAQQKRELEKQLKEETELWKNALGERAETDARLADQMAEEQARALQMFDRLRTTIDTSGQSAMMESVNAEQARVAELIALSKEVFVNESEVQRLITEVRRQGVEERKALLEDEAATAKRLREEELRVSVETWGAALDALVQFNDGVLGHSKKSAMAHWRLSQGLAIAKATLDAASAVAAVFAAEPGELVVKSGAALIAGIAAAGMVAAVVNAPEPQFRAGGPIGGRRHEQGGTRIEAEQGEYMLDRETTQNIGMDTLEGIRRNKGLPGAGNITIGLRVGHRMFDYMTVRSLRQHGALSRANTRLPTYGRRSG